MLNDNNKKISSRIQMDVYSTVSLLKGFINIQGKIRLAKQKKLHVKYATTTTTKYFSEIHKGQGIITRYA